MVKINLRDKNFTGDASSCHFQTNDNVVWERTNNKVSRSCFITDQCLQDVYKATNIQRKVAWLLEPREISPEIYNWIEHNNKLFDFVLTYDLHLVEKGENYLYAPWGGTWITNYIESEKTKNVSIIASQKNSAVGHQLRHSIIKTQPAIDVYGRGYNPVSNKEEALTDYKFSITIENSIQPGYWTEKIIDCFNTKTIPIYWGSDNISDYFNSDGIITFKTQDELQQILKDIGYNGASIYNDKKVAIEENFLKAKAFKTTEDWLFVNYEFLFN